MDAAVYVAAIAAVPPTVVALASWRHQTGKLQTVEVQTNGQLARLEAEIVRLHTLVESDVPPVQRLTFPRDQA